jgi:hypothetical protein
MSKILGGLCRKKFCMLDPSRSSDQLDVITRVGDNLPNAQSPSSSGPKLALLLNVTGRAVLPLLTKFLGLGKMIQCQLR